MYVWQMKGFNTDRIKKVIDGPIDKLTGEFVSFTMDIQRLIELQRRYGAVNIKELENKNIITNDDVKEIEKALFDPDKIDYLITIISEIETTEPLQFFMADADYDKKVEALNKKIDEILQGRQQRNASYRGDVASDGEGSPNGGEE